MSSCRIRDIPEGWGGLEASTDIIIEGVLVEFLTATAELAVSKVIAAWII